MTLISKAFILSLEKILIFLLFMSHINDAILCILLPVTYWIGFKQTWRGSLFPFTVFKSMSKCYQKHLLGFDSALLTD